MPARRLGTLRSEERISKDLRDAHMSFKFPMTRRRLISGAAAVLAMPAIRTQAAEAVRGGHLRIALYKDLATLSPVMGIFGNTWRTTINLYNNLTRLTANGGVEG